MPALRLQALAEVDAKIAAMQAEGAVIDMSLWRSLVRHPDVPGVAPEGFEFEGELEPGEKPWLEPASAEHAAEEAALDAELEERGAVVEAGEGSVSVLDIVCADGDDPVVVADAKERARNLDLMERLRALALEVKMPSICNQADARITRIKRGHNNDAAASRSAASRPGLNAVLRRALQEDAQAQGEVARAQREANWKEKCAAKEEAAVVRAEKQAADLAKHQKKVRKSELAKLPKCITSQDCGGGMEKGGGKKELAARMSLLERLKLKAPDLPLELEARWPEIKKGYAVRMGVQHKKEVGVRFITELKQVVDQLGEHLDSTADGAPPKAGGSKGAFEAFVRSISKPNSKVLTSLTL